MTEFDSGFNVELKYNTEKDLHLENILWTVRVSVLSGFLALKIDIINAF